MSKSPVYIGAGSSELAVISALNIIDNANDISLKLQTVEEWVSLTDGTTVFDFVDNVQTTEYSAKEYAQGTAATGGTAKQWALGGGSHVEATAVTGSSYSAKKYATDSAASATAAAASYDSFDDRYLGVKSSDPTLDNDSNALVDGALYFNTTTNAMMVYDLGGTAWVRTTPTSSDQTSINSAVANATNINKVAAIDANVTKVADIDSNVTTVAGIDSNVTTVAGISANTTTVAGISGNVTTVAGIASNVTAVAGDLGTADVVVDMNVLATADVVTDMNVLGTADVVTDMNVLGTADVVTDMNVLGTADVVTDMNTLGTADVVSDMNTLGTADVVNDMNVLGTSGNVTNMNTLSGISANITTVAGISANVTTVAGVSGNVTTVAGSIADVNRYAAEYQIDDFSPSAPSTDGSGASLSDGDLAYDTTANRLKVYESSSFVSIGLTLVETQAEASNAAVAMSIALG